MKVKVKNATKQGYALVGEGGVLDLSFPNSKTRRGRVIDGGQTTPTLDTSCEVGVIQVGQLYGTDIEPNPQAGRVYSRDGISPCMDSCGGATECQRLQMENIPNIRIRKLTPKECFRLQGWTDDYFEKAQQFNSDSQLYKQAGNGVTVNVIETIAKRFEDDDGRTEL